MIRRWLKNERSNRGVTQKYISDKAGIAQPYYHQIENGERRPSVEVAKKIATVLGIDWTRFFDEEESA
ncbi:MAG: helix-turn-helix transcriptional regulator [Clostridia bacterium]|nr:helix-turn-helix transcriptional regulator [Clostridia bacterium]